MKIEWEDAESVRDRLRQWHRWFCWHPVRVGKNDVRWLEYVERRGERITCWHWTYRALAA